MDLEEIQADDLEVFRRGVDLVVEHDKIRLRAGSAVHRAHRRPAGQLDRELINQFAGDGYLVEIAAELEEGVSDKFESASFDRDRAIVLDLEEIVRAGVR